MSTTWVFIGLLAGRELAIATQTRSYRFKNVFPLVGKDILKLLFGLTVSIAIAVAIQHAVHIGLFFSWLIDSVLVLL